MNLLFRLPIRFWVLILLPPILVCVGTFGYPLLEEEYSIFDGLYMTIITLSTIGYGETHALSTRGRIFTVFLILSGVFVIGYSGSEILRAIVSGQFADILGKRKMERALEQVNDHIIVCGLGRMGNLVCREFSRLGKQFVVIEKSEAELREFAMPGGITLQGDATLDEVLKKAGIERANYLVAVMASDADNLFTTLSARLLNAKLTIVARADDPQSEQKLMRAGANRVISPYQIGGTRVAHAVIKPTVVDFIELTTRTEHIELQLEEAKIEPNSALEGCALKDSRLRNEHQIIIVAIKKTSGEMVVNPPAETILEAGDILVAMGSLTHLTTLEEMARSRG
jgi:voltage-gated potassium channel